MENILNTIYLFIHQIIYPIYFLNAIKKSMIIPILKKPTLDTSVLLNYRPISQLPIINKVLERIICKQITEYLVTNNLYDPNQSAFRPSHSTETALNMVTDSILKSLDENHVAQLLLLVLTSAFDTILHKTSVFDWLKLVFRIMLWHSLNVIWKTDIIQLSLMNVNLN